MSTLAALITNGNGKLQSLNPYRQRHSVFRQCRFNVQTARHPRFAAVAASAGMSRRSAGSSADRLGGEYGPHVLGRDMQERSRSDAKLRYGGVRVAPPGDPLQRMTMARFKSPNFDERVAAGVAAKQSALERLRNKPAPDPVALAAREAAQRARDAKAAERRAARQAAAEEAAAAKAAAAEKAAIAAQPAVLSEAERKAERDARYAARKARKR